MASAEEPIVNEEAAAPKYVSEFVGTFLLIFTVGCNVLGGNAVWGGVSIACVLMVVIYAFGGVSGGNFNPAVSFALGLIKTMGSQGGMDWMTVGIYFAMQILGGIVAGACYVTLYWDAFNLAPAKGFGWFQAGLCEMLYTFMLVFVVLNVAGCTQKAGNQFYGLAIGFVVVAGAYGAGAVSGGCFNPAVAIGIDVSSAGLGFGWCLVYMVFEMLGAALAAAFFRLVHPEEFGAEGNPIVKNLVSEFLGTFILVLTVGLNVLGKSPAAAFSIAASLMCMIYALGDVSGAHFNPAVSVAILSSGLCEDFNAVKAVQHIGAQLLGACVAGATYASIYHGETFDLGPQGNFHWAEVAIAEIVFTFVLCFIVLSCAVSSKTKTTDMFGLAIGSCVTVGGFAIGGISGGSLNPAVSVGISVIHTINGGTFYKSLIYTLFELIGAAAAAGLIMLTHNEGKPAEKSAKAEA